MTRLRGVCTVVAVTTFVACGTTSPGDQRRHVGPGTATEQWSAPATAHAKTTPEAASDGVTPERQDAAAAQDAYSELPRYSYKVSARAYWIDPSNGTEVDKWQRRATRDSLRLTVEVTNQKENGHLNGDYLTVFVAFDALYAPVESQDPEQDGDWGPAAWGGMPPPQTRPIPSIPPGQVGKVEFEGMPVGKALRAYALVPPVWGIRANVVLLDRNGHWQASSFAKLMVAPTPNAPRP